MQGRRKTWTFPLHRCPQHPLAVGNAPSLHPLKLSQQLGKNSAGCQRQLQPTQPCPLSRGLPVWGSAPPHHNTFRPLSGTVQPSSMLISFISFVSYQRIPLLPRRAPGKANAGLPGTINHGDSTCHPASCNEPCAGLLNPKLGGDAHALIIN